MVVSSVRLPQYLDRSEIITRDGANRLQLAEFARQKLPPPAGAASRDHDHGAAVPVGSSAQAHRDFIAVAAVTSAVLLRRSRWGLALVAIGGDEERAEVLGVRPTWIKIGVFVLSAGLMGATGAAIAPRWTYLDPQIAFNPLTSFQVIIMALLGGVGRPAGPVVGALFLGLLSELFLIQFRYVYMIVLGVVLIVTVLGLPHGIMGWRADERTEDLVRRLRWAIAKRIPRRFTMRRDYQLYIDGEWSERQWTRGCYNANHGPHVWTTYGQALTTPIGVIHWASTDTATYWSAYMEGAVDAGERGFPVHRRLLGHGVVVLEGLDLAGVEPGPYELVALPLLIPGSDGAPARAMLRG